jgi:hypothetical protein
LIIHFTAEFYQYGDSSGGTAVTLSKIVVIFVRTAPSLAASYCMLLYLRCERHGHKLSFIWMLTTTTLVTSALALLVVETFLQFDFLPVFTKFTTGNDYMVFYVLANALVAAAGFAVIVLFFHTHVIAPQSGIALRTIIGREQAH